MTTLNSFIVLGTQINDSEVIERYERFILSEKFGWTPLEIDNLSEEDYRWYLKFIEKFNEREEREANLNKKNYGR